MSGYYDQKILVALKREIDLGVLVVVSNPDEIFGQLGDSYHVCGSKICWSQIPGSVESHESDPTKQHAKNIEFFDEICRRYKLSGAVTYAGDSAIDFALQGSLSEIRKILPILLNVPQHHYIIDAGFAWCMSFTMEGDMAYGAAPSNRPTHDS